VYFFHLSGLLKLLNVIVFGFAQILDAKDGVKRH